MQMLGAEGHWYRSSMQDEPLAKRLRVIPGKAHRLRAPAASTGAVPAAVSAHMSFITPLAEDADCEPPSPQPTQASQLQLSQPEHEALFTQQLSQIPPKALTVSLDPAVELA